jgi:hypothetical protein
VREFPGGGVGLPRNIGPGSKRRIIILPSGPPAWRSTKRGIMPPSRGGPRFWYSRPPRRPGGEPGRIEPGQRVPAAEELRPGQDGAPGPFPPALHRRAQPVFVLRGYRPGWAALAGLHARVGDPGAPGVIGGTARAVVAYQDIPLMRNTPKLVRMLAGRLCAIGRTRAGHRRTERPVERDTTTYRAQSADSAR